MKKLLQMRAALGIGFALILCALQNGGAEEPVTKLVPEAGWATARAKAKNQGRLLFLMFVQDDCKHCQRFAEKVLDDESFRAFARESLAMLIYDIDQYDSLSESERKTAEDLQIAHEVDTTPTIVVFDPAGNRLLRTEGYRGTPAKRIIKQLTEMLPK